MFDIKPSQLPGCFELAPAIFDDSRGRFVKVFQTQEFARLGLETDFHEEYYSVSRKNVIRGLHFQVPPMDCLKLVYCVHGEVLDAVVDLRVNSPTYGRYALFQLNSVKANSVYIPKGMAHGFCVTSEIAYLVYKVSAPYSQECDSGILWNSAKIPWPVTDAVLSARDKNLIALKDFNSPFFM